MEVDVIEAAAVPAALNLETEPAPVSTEYRPPIYRLILTAIVAIGPLVMGGFVIANGIGEPIPWRDVALATLFYVVISHSITVGFHRLFSHRSFEARRPLKIALAVLGSMAFQGSLIGWVADHRRHHRYSDGPGDPHSPVWGGNAPTGGWRGLWHAHVGWTFNSTPTSREEFAPDLLADPDLVLIDRLFVVCCVLTLTLPFGIGYLLTGTLAGATAALVWAGILRVGVSHNFTWSINSVCHRFGKRPFNTRDSSTNFAPLALFTCGESFHNAHHAFPTLARHGVDPHQLDSSAGLIRMFERWGWATNARWPQPALIEARRR